MVMDDPSPASVDDYIAAFPDAVQTVLQEMRRAVQRAAPTATESISYGMPTVSAENTRVHFAGWKQHVALYAIPVLDGEVESELLRYRGDKGTLKFPLAEPVPYDLIERAVAATLEKRS
jgi:uncharacterized protein YdhG (YjbR/CyaY superfamily)